MKPYKTFIVENHIESLKLLRVLLQSYPEKIDTNDIVSAQTFIEAKEILAKGSKFELSIIDKFLGGRQIGYDLVNERTKKYLGIIVLNSIDKETQKINRQMQPMGNYLTLGKPFTRRGVAALMEDIEALNSDKVEATSINYDNREFVITNAKTDFFVIPKEKVIYAEIQGNDLTIHFLDKKEEFLSVSITNTLTEFIRFINEPIYQQINRHYVINTHYINSFNKATKTIILAFNTFLPINKGNPERKVIKMEVPVVYSQTYASMISEKYPHFKSTNG